jgi:hypothetical protein
MRTKEMKRRASLYEMALSAAKRKRKFVVRRGGFSHPVYLQKDGSWGIYRTAKRFTSQDKAENFYRANYGGEDFGIFPVS